MICYGTWQVWNIKTFMDTHSLTIQNALSIQDEIQGKNLDAINCVSYKNWFEFTTKYYNPLLNAAILALVFLQGIDMVEKWLEGKEHEGNQG